MNNRAVVTEAHREISLAYNHSANGVAVTNMGPVAIWVLKDTILYLEAMLHHGHWRLGGLKDPVIEVRTLASRYGVVL